MCGAAGVDRAEEGTAETGRVERDRFVTDSCCLDLTVSESGNLDVVRLYAYFDRLKAIILRAKELEMIIHNLIKAVFWQREGDKLMH